MKRNYIKSILTLFTLAIILSGAALTANAQAQYRKALDKDGDGRADLTVTRTVSGSRMWYTRLTQTGALVSGNWGNGNLEFEVAGDYDGDGKGDYAVIRRNEPTSVWYILPSGGGGFRAVPFGVSLPADNPV